jgi:hypothetical protein
LKKRSRIIPEILLLMLAWFAGFDLCAQMPVQDTIYLMNGNIVAEKVVDTIPGTVSIYHPEKHAKLIQFDWNQLFMIRFSDGFRRYYYTQDTTINNWFTREEMTYFLHGERDARKSFKARGSLIGAGVAGLIGGLTGTIWGPVAPYGFMALTGIPRVRIREETISQPSFIDHDTYILGYERVARQKRKMKSLIGGTIGLVAGYGLWAIVGRYYPETVTFGR